MKPCVVAHSRRAKDSSSSGRVSFENHDIPVSFVIPFPSDAPPSSFSSLQVHASFDHFTQQHVTVALQHHPLSHPLRSASFEISVGVDVVDVPPVPVGVADVDLTPVSVGVALDVDVDVPPDGNSVLESGETSSSVMAAKVSITYHRWLRGRLGSF